MQYLPRCPLAWLIDLRYTWNYNTSIIRGVGYCGGKEVGVWFYKSYLPYLMRSLFTLKNNAWITAPASCTLLLYNHKINGHSCISIPEELLTIFFHLFLLHFHTWKTAYNFYQKYFSPHDSLQLSNTVKNTCIKIRWSIEANETQSRNTKTV